MKLYYSTFHFLKVFYSVAFSSFPVLWIGLLGICCWVLEVVVGYTEKKNQGTRNLVIRARAPRPLKRGSVVEVGSEEDRERHAECDASQPGWWGVESDNCLLDVKVNGKDLRSEAQPQLFSSCELISMKFDCINYSHIIQNNKTRLLEVNKRWVWSPWSVTYNTQKRQLLVCVVFIILPGTRDSLFWEVCFSDSSVGWIRLQ